MIRFLHPHNCPRAFTEPLIHVACPGFALNVAQDAGGRWFLQVSADGGSGRKWWLSLHMTPSEVVRTLFMAMMAFQEHELRESFTYWDARIFSPHIDVDALTDVAHKEDRRRGEPAAWEQEECHG